MKLRVIIAVFSVVSLSNGLKCATKVNWKGLTSEGTREEETTYSCEVRFLLPLKHGMPNCYDENDERLFDQFRIRSSTSKKKLDEENIIWKIKEKSNEQALAISMNCKSDMCNSLHFAANITKAVERVSTVLLTNPHPSLAKYVTYITKECHLEYLAKVLEKRYREKFSAQTTKKPTLATSRTSATDEIATTKEASTEAPSTTTEEPFGDEKTDGAEPKTPTAAPPKTTTSESPETGMEATEPDTTSETRTTSAKDDSEPNISTLPEERTTLTATESPQPAMSDTSSGDPESTTSVENNSDELSRTEPPEDSVESTLNNQAVIDSESTTTTEKSGKSMSTSSEQSNITESNDVAHGTNETEKDEDQSVQNENSEPVESALQDDAVIHHDVAMMLLIALGSAMTLVAGLAAVIVFKMMSMLE